MPSSSQQPLVNTPNFMEEKDWYTNCDFYLSSARGSCCEGPGITADLWDPERPGGRTKQLRPHGEIKETRREGERSIKKIQQTVRVDSRHRAAKLLFFEHEHFWLGSDSGLPKRASLANCPLRIGSVMREIP